MTDDRPGEPHAYPPGPGGAGATTAEEPPPITAFAWRNGLVRPAQGRLLVGVCGALGRATNTDPILWRVILAVLTFFGGIGALAYLLGWILLPADGDTASPLEALLGRGRSGTSTILTVIGGLIALVSVGAFVSEPFRPGLLGAGLLAGAVLLLLRDQRGRNRPATPPVWPAPGTTTPTPTAGASAAAMTGDSSMPRPATSRDSSMPRPATSRDSMTDLPGAPPQAPTDLPYTAFHAGYAPQTPYAPPPLYTAQPPYPPAPPFAPRGPFVPPPPMPPTRQFTPGPAAPRPPKVRSRLGRLTFSLVLVAIGILAALDYAGRDVPAGAYPAAALAVVALGLILGAWAGRARGLIAFGIVLSVALASAFAADRVNRDWPGGTTTYLPSSLSQVESDYNQDVGDVRLDLSKVDFSTATVATVVSIRVDAGSLTIILPPNVDVVVDATADAGNVDVLGQSWSGFGLNTRTVTDNGADGAGGGQLQLSAAISVGNLEVHR